MDIDPSTDGLFLPPGISPSEVCPKSYRDLVDWFMPKGIGQPWHTVYEAVVDLGQITNSALESARADESMERGADATFRIAVALLLEEIEAPAEIDNPWQAARYLASAHPDDASVAHVNVENVGVPEGLNKMIKAYLQ